MTKLSDQLKRHEGIRLKPYRDTVGKLTIGVGRNLDDVGITAKEAEMMLTSDILTAEIELIKALPFVGYMDQCRVDALLNMVFNIGLPRFRGFKKMIAALAVRDYNTAAKEMMDSKWARQVGNRAVELSQQMRSGQYDY